MPTVQSRGETCRHCKLHITRTRGAFFGDDDSLFCPAAGPGKFHDPIPEDEPTPEPEDLTPEPNAEPGDLDPRILKRIRDLFKLAEDPRTPQAEAENAAAMAERLMLKHSIARAQVAADDETKQEDLAEHTERFGGVTYKPNKMSMLSGIARVFGVFSFKRNGADELVLVGTQFNIDSALRVFASVLRQGDNFSRYVTGEASRWDSRPGAQAGANKRARNAWWAGYANRIVERVDGQRRAAAEELGIEGRTGTALVLMSEHKRAQAEAQTRYKITFTSARRTVSDADAYRRGQDDANRATIRR